MRFESGASLPASVCPARGFGQVNGIAVVVFAQSDAVHDDQQQGTFAALKMRQFLQSERHPVFLNFFFHSDPVLRIESGWQLNGRDHID